MRKLLPEDPNDSAFGWNKKVEIPDQGNWEAMIYSKPVEGYRME